MNKTSLNLKIPTEAHKDIKIFAATKGAKLIPLTEQIIIDASQKEEVLEQALKNLQTEKK